MAISAAAAFGDETAPPKAGPAGFALDIHATLAAAEPTWRSLEAACDPSPYQRFDWVEAFAAATGADVRVAIARDEAGPAVLLPLLVASRFGLRLGHVPGGSHANLFAPLVRANLAGRLEPERAMRLLGEAGAAMRLDAVALTSVPVDWGGAHPFAAGGAPSPSPAYRLRLAGDGATTLGRSMSADARKKLRSKERQLAKLGAVAFVEAREPAGVDNLLQAFFRQKAERFQKLGVVDPFTDPRIQDFVRRACLAGLAEGRPAIALYGLVFEGRPIAIFGGAAAPERLSGMFVSFEESDVARYSPGDLLIARVIARQCELGRKVFDLGVGEARYKRSFCHETEPLVEVCVPMTMKGRAFAAAQSLVTRSKRRIKADARAMAILSRVRRGLAKLRR